MGLFFNCFRLMYSYICGDQAIRYKVVWMAAEFCISASSCNFMLYIPRNLPAEKLTPSNPRDMISGNFIACVIQLNSQKV